jgi:hypothetical protein
MTVATGARNAIDAPRSPWRQARREQRELLGERAVEPERGAEPGHVARARGLAEHDLDGIARHGVQEREHEQA